MTRPRPHPLLDLLLLTALCLGSYLPGLTTYGLGNWQEAQRALVAREMQDRREWIVPTAGAQPYLAKPPMIYWCQMALAGARGARSGELDLRLTVALAGWLGVLATYGAARRMLGSAGFGAIAGLHGPSAARWSALFLATGVLYVHSSRVGELDILLAPFTVVAVWGVFEAWRSAAERGRTAIGWLALAALAGVGAALTKGPPAILTIGIAAYGGIMAWCASAPQVLPQGEPRPARRAGAAFGAAAFLILAVYLGEPRDPRAWLGVLLLALGGGLLGAALAGLANPRRARACARLLSKTHPLAVLGLPLAAYFGWLWAAAARIEPGAAVATFETERSDNLRLFVPESPLNNLEGAAFGAGLGSLAAAAAIVWIIRRRIVPGPALWVLLAWTVGGLIAFSTLGKGVPRYLTALWPGMAMLGAVWFASLIPRLPRGPWMRRGALAAILAIALAQAWWYGWQRQRAHPDRSPRDLIAELLASGIEPERLGMFEFDSPAVDFYAGRPVPSYVDIVPRPGLVGVGPRSIGDLRLSLGERGEAVLLVRRTQPGGQEPTPARDRITAAGLALEEVPTRASLRIDNAKTEVGVFRVRAKPF
ncbi:MAG: hypothetical protein WD749_00285 [Phycisphaerales bacterium]